MKRIISKDNYIQIVSKIKEYNSCCIHGKIEGLIVGIEELFEDLYTKNKVINKPIKRLGLYTLKFVSNSEKDLKIFFDYIGYFNEGNIIVILNKNTGLMNET